MFYLIISPSIYTPHAHSARIIYRFRFARLRNVIQCDPPACRLAHLASCLVLLAVYSFHLHRCDVTPRADDTASIKLFYAI